MPEIQTFKRTDLAAFGSVIYPPKGTYFQDRQDIYQLVCVHQGSLDLKINDRKYRLGRETMFMMLPGNRYDFTFSRTRSTWHTWVNFYKAEYSTEKRKQLDQVPVPLPLSPAMARVIDSLIAMSQEGRSDDAPVFILQAAVALELYMYESRKHLAAGMQIHPAVERAHSFIMENLDQEIRLADIAAYAHVAPEYLVRLFKAAGNRPPVEYLWRKRVDIACELLRSSGLGFEEISRRAGFKSPYHFSRKIRESTGLPPREYRRKYS